LNSCADGAPNLHIYGAGNRFLALRNKYTYNKEVLITFDHAKRDKTLAKRGLDFQRADEAFAGIHLTRADDRRDYGEPRFVTAGWLDQRIVVIVWTPRGAARRIISMRKANEREVKTLSPHLA
jgi:uncharacterized DUF497 family protein